MTAPLQLLAAARRAVRAIGYTPGLGEFEKRKLSVFNQLNFFGLLCGLAVPVIGLFDAQQLPFIATLVAFSPAVISGCVLWLNGRRRHEAARFLYFSLYPVLTAMVYAAGLDVGIELFFVLYGILAVFYMRRRWQGAVAFFISAGCYTAVFVFSNKYTFSLKASGFAFYVFNHVLAVVLIFYALRWLKQENDGYRRDILKKNASLKKTALKVRKQKETIAKKAEELTELNNLKSKLFSVISHDLKNPLYAMRNLFRNAAQDDLSGEELKAMVPEIVSDLNYVTALMENLLQWSKSQMQAHSVRPQLLDLNQQIEETTRMLRLQAEAKKVYVHNKTQPPVYVFADKDVLNLVLRNLLSNAIKYTPANGNVYVETTDHASAVEIAVQDTGVGMNKETMEKLAQNNFYSTKGTADESGTGLGLMLCREYLKKMGSRMYIESEEGKGSTFSFTLLKPQSLN